MDTSQNMSGRWLYKKISASLVIREMSVEPLGDTTSHPPKWLRLKGVTITSFGEVLWDWKILTYLRDRERVPIHWFTAKCPQHLGLGQRCELGACVGGRDPVN